MRRSFLNNGIQQRTHGNFNRLPHNGFMTNELKNIVMFLQNYAETNAILLPGRIPGYKRSDVQLLPTHLTKKEVWMDYVKATASLTFRLAGYQSFCDIWRKYLPQILITKPRSDLCFSCQQNSLEITLTANKSEQEKQRVI